MDRTEELVNLVIDGEASPEEQAELERLLLTSPETRQLFETTRDLCQRLDSMPQLEVPRRKAPVSIHSRRRLVFGLAWAAAAAFVLVFLLNNPISHRRDTAATMAPVVADLPSLVVRRQGDLYSLEPRIARRPARVTVRFDRANLTFIGISGGQDASSSKVQASFTLRSPSDRAVVLVRPYGRADWRQVRVSAVPIE